MDGRNPDAGADWDSGAGCPASLFELRRGIFLGQPAGLV
jgi:hypothetical protein